MAKTDVQYAIDTPRSVRNGGSVIISGGGSGGGGSTVDLSLYVKKDGTVPMTGNFDVGGFGIVNVGLVDGVDISAHVDNANAHHNKVHVLADTSNLGPDHTITGTAGQVLRVYAANAARFENLSHTDLSNVLPDQHHPRKHNVTSTSDHEVTGTSQYDIFGIPTTANVLGFLTPSYAPTGASILRSDNSGGLTLKELRIGSAMTLFDDGDVSIVPDILLGLSGLIAAENDFHLNYDSNGDNNGSLYIRYGADTSSGTLVARFDANGNLGLGMSAGASYRLDVSGNARISATAQATTLIATTKLTTPLIDSASGSVTISPFNSTAIINSILQVPTINTAAGQSLTLSPAVSLLLNPGDNRVIVQNGKSIRTNVFVSGFAGSGFHIDQGILNAGKTTIEVDNLTVRGSMSVYELLIRQIRATNGSLFVSSTAKAKQVSGPVSGKYTISTITADETAGASTNEAHGFLVGDVIRAQRTRWNGSAFVGIYQSDMIVTDVTNLYEFKATLSSGDDPAIGYEYVRLGNTGAGSGRQGTIYLTSDDSASPFIDIINGVASHANWNSTGFVKARLGLITGITSSSNEYGLIAGNGIFSPTDPTAKYIKASNEGVSIYGAGLVMYKSGVQTVNIGNDGTMWLGTSSSNKLLEFDGTTLNLRAALLIGPQIPNMGFATDALLYCAYDGSFDGGNNAGNATGHLGQKETFSGLPQFRPGKFGKAIESCEALTSTTINQVVNSSLEDGTVGGDPTNFNSGAPTAGQFAVYVNGTAEASSSITISEDISYDGKRSYKISRVVLTANATTNYGIRYRFNVTTGLSYSIQVKVFVASLTGQISGDNVKLLTSANVTAVSPGIAGTTGDWVTLKITTTATATGTAFLYVYSDNCENATIYVDAIQVTNTAYHLPYYCPKITATTPSVTYETSRTAAYVRYLNQPLNFGKMTISTWFYLEDYASVVGRNLRICEIISGSNRTNITITTTDDPTVFYTNNGASVSLTNFSTNVAPDMWHHVAVTFDNGTFKMYLDGVLFDTDTMPGVITGLCEVRVGAYVSGQPLNGWIDDFAILPRALSAEEIAQVYSSAAPLKILSSAFELQLMKTNSNGNLSTIVAHGGGIFASTETPTSTAAVTPSFALLNDDLTSWAGFSTLKAGDVIIGNSATNYLRFQKETGTMTLKGQLIITGASGYASFTDKPTSLGDIDSTQNTKLNGIAAGATVGATWGTNLNMIPPRFGNSPGDAGLYLTASNLGYWNGSNWKVWISSAGQFYFGSDTGARLQWNGTVLAGYNSSNVAQWSADSTDGLMKVGQGQMVLSSTGIRLIYTGVWNSDTIGDSSKLVWYENPVTSSGKILEMFLGDANIVQSATVRPISRQPALHLKSNNSTYPEIVLENNTAFWKFVYTEANFDPSIYALLSNPTFTAGIGIANGIITSDNVFKMQTSAAGVQSLYAKSLLASSSYSHSTRIPTNGIYSLGAVSIGKATAPDASYMLDVTGNAIVSGSMSVGSLASNGVITGTAIAASSNNDITTGLSFQAPKLTSTPSLADGKAMMYFKETGGSTRVVFAYREGATTWYYYCNLEDLLGGWTHSNAAP